MNTFTMIAPSLSLLAVVAVMGLGVFAMAKGGEFNKKYGNKLMRLRVMLQGVALALLAVAYFSS
ncbi:MAG TPA: twin transmembrane helix small protein [Alphaproteobacteria bacterium]|nr:twin transmembrane helix small protein [Alphaproteobacteria bacterium]